MLLEGLSHHLLEKLLVLVPVDVDKTFIVLLQGVQVSHLHDLLVLCVLLDLVLALLLLCLQEQAHLELRERELTLSILCVFFGIHRLLEVNELTSRMASDIDVAMADFLVIGDLHDLHLDEVVAFMVLEVVEELQGRV